MFSSELYVGALRFAAERHGEQKMPGGTLPYAVHFVAVTAEVMAVLPEPGVDPQLAMVCALLHDTIEDTAKSYAEKVSLAEEIERRFGVDVRAGVWALTKFKELADGTKVEKEAQTVDSLERIKRQPAAVAAVKLADRITNLAPPPADWPKDKRTKYLAQAQTILQELGEASPKLATRLRERMVSYAKHCG